MLAETALSMLLTFLLLPKDKPKVVKFTGSDQARFERAVRHYTLELGVMEEELVFITEPKHPLGWCSSVQQQNISLPGFHTQRVVVVKWYGKDGQSRSCKRRSPEFWGLHEAAHLSLGHHLMPTHKNNEKAVDRLIKKVTR